jgi:hypothetical protein
MIEEINLVVLDPERLSNFRDVVQYSERRHYIECTVRESE